MPTIEYEFGQLWGDEQNSSVGYFKGVLLINWERLQLCVNKKEKKPHSVGVCQKNTSRWD